MYIINLLYSKARNHLQTNESIFPFLSFKIFEINDIYRSHMRKLSILFLSFILIVLLLNLAQAQTTSKGAIILLDEWRSSFDSQGKEKQYVHIRIKILNRKGIQEFGEVVIPFSTEFERLKVLHAFTLLPNGIKIKPNSKAYNIVSPPFVKNAPIYSDLKYQTISMPALCPEVIIDYAYEIKTIKPYMKGNFWSSNLFQQYYPVKRAVYRLEFPADKSPKIRTKNLIAAPVIEEKKGRKIYTWELRNLPAIDKECSAPPLGEIAAHIAVSSISDWNKVASWYTKLANGAMQPDEAIEKKARELTTGLNNSWQKVEAIYNYVATNIRYVGVEFGISGYKPHPAAQTFRLRYGDCKDHSTLLISMLRAVEIDAYPVLIPTSSVSPLDTGLPTPGVFNHEIAAVHLNGKFIFLDSTAETASCGMLPPSDQGRKVLIIDGEKAILAKTPVFPSSFNQENYRGDFKITGNGALEGQVKFGYSGVYAMFERHRFLYATEREKRQSLEAKASEISPGTSIDDIHISDFHDLNQSEVISSFHLKDNQFATKTAHMLLFHPPVVIYTRLSQQVAAKKHKYSYRIGYRMEKHAHVVITLPDGYVSFFIPENYTYENKIGNFCIRWRKEGEKIIYASVLSLKQAEISSQDYPSLRMLFNNAVKATKNQIIILKQKR